MKLSIIICSYDRYKLLARSVAAVGNSKSFDPQIMEIIIVENTPAARRQGISTGIECRIVPCDQVGLSHARNAGIVAALGEIVAFVDDDALVHDNWCSAVLAAFQNYPEAEICGGRTEPLYSSTKRPSWFYQELCFYLSCINWGPDSHPLKPGQWIVGANMAFRKAIFDKIGCFDPSLGRQGNTSLLSNEEVAMMRKVGNDRVYYIHDMVVDHIISEDRISLAWFRKRAFWQAVSDVQAGERYPKSGEAAEELYKIVSRAPAEYRGPRLFSYEPRTPDAFKDQLQAIYLLAIQMASGIPTETLKD